MKELSIEEKSSRYDEAIKRVENIRTGKCETTFMFTEGLFEYIFPELAELEDERIKDLIYLSIEKGMGIPSAEDRKKALAWIEKKGEQNLANSTKTCKDEQKSAWSEEDEKMVKCCEIALEFFENHGKNSPSFPHENYFELNERIYPSEVNRWLKYLKERCTWKPSDEQMKAIQKSIGIVGELTPRGECLKELEEQLKKLKG